MQTGGLTATYKGIGIGYIIGSGYTLSSVIGSGHVKHKRNSLACKIHENSACNIGDSACNRSRQTQFKVYVFDSNRVVCDQPSAAVDHIYFPFHFGNV